jgi:hypothetical protein
MIDTTFEGQLSGLLREYAETGVRPIDRFTIAEETIARGRTLPGSRWSVGRARRPLRLALVGVLIVAIAAGVAFVGSRLLAPPTLPTPHTYLNQLVAAPDLPMPMGGPVVPLLDGRVLVMGGRADAGGGATAVVYDPTTGTSLSPGPMLSPDGSVGPAVRLRDGRVLIIGEAVNQIFDPTTMRFTALGPTVTRRLGGEAALLHDGRVLIAGGMPPGGSAGEDPALQSAELFDPETLTSAPTGSIGTPTGGGPMVTLPDGRVFMAVDRIYDPATGTFGAGNTTSSDGGGRPVALPDGRVVMVSSTGFYAGGRIAIWDPASATIFTRDLPEPLTDATMLDDGRVFLIGMCRGRQTGWTGIFDPATGVTIPGPTTYACRPTSTRLADGRVLIVGGTINGDALQAVPTVEVFQ